MLPRVKRDRCDGDNEQTREGQSSNCSLRGRSATEPVDAGNDHERGRGNGYPQEHKAPPDWRIVLLMLRARGLSDNRALRMPGSSRRMRVPVPRHRHFGATHQPIR